MIKKDYKKPTMKVVKIQQSQMLCSSPATLNGSKDGDNEPDWADLE